MSNPQFGGETGRGPHYGNDPYAGNPSASAPSSIDANAHAANAGPGNGAAQFPDRSLVQQSYGTVQQNYGTQGYSAQSYGAQAAQPASADLPPMGWYPDPAGSPQERYWDGSAWTHNLRPAEQFQAAQPLPGGHLSAQPQYGYSGASQQYAGNPYGGSYGGAPANYATGQSNSPTTADGVPLAGWWWRVLASVIDSFVLGVVAQIVQLPFAGALSEGLLLWFEDFAIAIESGSTDFASPLDPQYGISGPLVGIMVATNLVTFLYGFLLLRYKGATLGHMACGLRVVPTDQGRAPEGLSWGQAGLRHFMYMFIGLVPIVNIVNYLMAAFSDKRQTWHDMIAKTQVVKIR